MRLSLYFAMATALLISATAALGQGLTASLDRSTIFEGETVLLRIDQLNPTEDATPDYTPLAADFRVLDTGINRSMELTNGVRRILVQHNVLLEPRRDGEIVVPPLQVGLQQTSPLKLTVMKRPDGTRSPDQDVYIEVEADPVDPYVHAQIRFTVRLFHSPPITEGNLTPDAWPEGVVVERIGEDKTYQARKGDARYRVIERRYALFPERSGELELPEIRFRGRVADPSVSRNSLFSRGRRVSVYSEPVKLEVRPQPANYTGENWIPAADFEVIEVWPDGDPRFVMGEPLTRTLIVKARGLLAAQLPDLRLPEADGFKVYPDQAVTRTHAEEGWAVAQREQKYALVPTSTGRLVLPEIRVPWWDTQADRMREFVLPAREVDVLPGSAPLKPPPESLLTDGAAESLAAGGGAGAANQWPWRELALLFAGLWMATGFLWWRSGNRGQGRVPRQKVPAAASSHWKRDLKQACDAGDPRGAARAIRGLVAEAAGRPVHSLAEAARLIDDPGLVEAVLDLDRHLYRGGDCGWDPTIVKSAAGRLEIRRPKETSTANHDPLPPLYPA